MAEELPTVVTAHGVYVATIDPPPVDVTKEGRRQELAALADRIEAAKQRASDAEIDTGELAETRNGPEITP